MTYALDDLWSGAPGLTITMFVAAVITAVLSALSIFASLYGRETTSRRRLALSIPPLAATFVFTVSLVLLVRGARAEVVGAVLGPLDLGEAATQVARSLSVQLNGLMLGSTIAALVLPLGIAGGCFPWASKGPARSAILALAAGSSVPLVIAARAGASYAGELILAFGSVANVDAASKTAMLRAALDEASASMDATRLAMGATALIAVIVVSVYAARAARAGAVVRSRAVVGAAGVALLGAAALVATRGLAHDTRHPVGLGGPPLPFATDVELPRFQRCEPGAISIPLLVVSDLDATLDGRTMASPADATRDLDTLRRNWSVLHPRGEPAGAVRIVSDGDTSVATLAPWLRAVRAAGFARAEIVSVSVTTFETETLGTLERRTPCGRRFTIDPQGIPITRYASWRALASDAESGTLRVAP